MYKQVKTDKVATRKNGGHITPVATLSDEYGGRLQITVDDHCYVLYLKQYDGTYCTTTHIFSEAFDVLVRLPDPGNKSKRQTHHEWDRVWEQVAEDTYCLRVHNGWLVRHTEQCYTPGDVINAPMYDGTVESMVYVPGL